MLRPYGPNDGLALLTDEIAPGSLTVVALGNDHFFAEDADIDRKTAALIKLVSTYSDEAMASACTGQARKAARIDHPPNWAPRSSRVQLRTATSVDID